MDRRAYDRYRKGLNTVSESATDGMGSYVEASGVETFDEAIAALMEYLDTYGIAYMDMAGELAADFYAATTGGAFRRADMPQSLPRGQVEAIVHGNAAQFSTTDTLIEGVQRSMERLVVSSAGRTVSNAAVRDGVRFVRVPQGDCCDFCLMLASRGFVYANRKTAGEMNRYHDGCKCLIVASDENHPALEGYDPDALYNMWKNQERYEREDGGTSFRSLGDPAREYYGSAKEQDSQRFNEINRIYEQNGVEIVSHPIESEGIAYEPSLTPGKPGRLHRTDEMSLSAEEHEFVHFIHDKELGYPGLSYYLTHQDVWDDMERSSYGKELEMARQAGNDILEKRIKEQMERDFKRRGRSIDE